MSFLKFHFKFSLADFCPATLGSTLDSEVELMIPGMRCWTWPLSAASPSPRVWISVSEKIKTSANGLEFVFVTLFTYGELTQTSGLMLTCFTSPHA